MSIDCHECGSRMNRETYSDTFTSRETGSQFQVDGLESLSCEQCGREIISEDLIQRNHQRITIVRESIA